LLCLRSNILYTIHLAAVAQTTLYSYSLSLSLRQCRQQIETTRVFIVQIISDYIQIINVFQLYAFSMYDAYLFKRENTNIFFLLPRRVLTVLSFGFPHARSRDHAKVEIPEIQCLCLQRSLKNSIP